GDPYLLRTDDPLLPHLRRTVRDQTGREQTEMTTYEGDFSTPAGRFALVAARFNETVVEGLVSGALDCLKRHGVDEGRIDLVRVPGSFEIPLVAHRLAMSKRYAAVVCLGAVIRGETGHYDHVAGSATGGIARASLDSGV